LHRVAHYCQLADALWVVSLTLPELMGLAWVPSLRFGVV
jgi:hypothetical protein